MISLSEVWSSFNGLEKHVFIATVLLCLVVYLMCKDRINIWLGAFVAGALVISVIYKVYNYYGGGKEGVEMVGAFFMWGGLSTLFIGWLRSDLTATRVIAGIVCIAIGIPLMGIFTL